MKAISIVSKNNQGITLIEVVIGIIIIGIALTFIASVFAPQVVVHLQPMYQVRATELARSFLTDILARSFDENSDRTGGETFCGPVSGNEVSTGNCTLPAAFGSESGEAFNTFNDVDDFHDFCGASHRLSGPTLADLLDLADGAIYESYQIEVCVRAAGAELIPGVSVSDGTIAKRIEVTVFLPNGDQIAFVAYRSNF